MAAVRKRIVIAVVAVLVVGVLSYVFSGPKRGSVEWHKREYLKALYGPPWRNWGLPFVRDRSMERCEEHQRALIDLGYLEERTFVVSNVSFSRVSAAIHNVNRRRKHVSSEFDSVALIATKVIETNGVRVVATRGNMLTVEEVMKELDAVPETVP